MKRPVLSLQTVYFDESDCDDAHRLGSNLYERLTRAIKDPLGHGPGNPVVVGVQAEREDLQAAETMVVIAVLGKETYFSQEAEVRKQARRVASLPRARACPRDSSSPAQIRRQASTHRLFSYPEITRPNPILP